MSDAEKWCIKCREGLAGSETDNMGIFGLASGSVGLYCENEECERYGLITVAFLNSKSKAPKDAKPDKPKTPPTQRKDK